MGTGEQDVLITIRQNKTNFLSSRRQKRCVLLPIYFILFLT